MCQAWVLVVPVHGLSWVYTRTLSDGGSFGAGSYLEPGEKWLVDWVANASVSVSIEDPDGVLLYT
ncbi:MAG: hypothetical protein LUQ65_15030, partial [Candidatus Helarchaeota archaeon]|nr:hypothetical protein [Candidatus Helarchaeota archaeon]